MTEEKYQTLSEQSNSRWWDFYFVRYCMGTIAGSLLIFYVLSAGKDGKNVFYGGIYDLLKLGDYGLLVLPIMGLAYCYFASAPILVLHACRSAIVQYEEKCIFTAIISVALLLFLSLAVTSFFNIESSISVLLLIFIVGGQISCIYKSIGTRSDSYIKLSAEKSKAQSKGREFIESYKHLREHGNAFMILTMEILLAVIFYGVSSPSDLIVVLLFWIFPAAYVWFIGNYLEKDLIK